MIEELDELEERALFARRAEVMAGPPPALAIALQARLAAEASPMRSRVAAGVVRILRRGHFTAACAAALFLVAAFSRMGNGSMTVTASPSIAVDGEWQTSGILASMPPSEAYACSIAAAPVLAKDDVGVSSSSSTLASLEGVLACGGEGRGSRPDTSCEPSVTCSSLRQ